MEIKHHWEKAEYVTISDVCSEDELRLCKNELEILSKSFNSPDKTEAAIDSNGDLLKENKGIFFNQAYNLEFLDFSPCVKVVDKIIDSVRSGNYTPHSYMNYISRGFVNYGALVSGYRHGDYYKPHYDSATLTVLFWVRAKDFSGGNLKFVEFNEEIEFQDNFAIVFPSHYLHEVDTVTSTDGGYARYVISAFLNPQKGKK